MKLPARYVRNHFSSGIDAKYELGHRCTFGLNTMNTRITTPEGSPYKKSPNSLSCSTYILSICIWQLWSAINNISLLEFPKNPDQ